MKRTLLLITLLPQLCLAEKPLGEQLTSALYAEEVERDLIKAAQQYEALLEKYDQQRDIANAAMKRLSEIYQKQGMNDKAQALKQRFAQEAPNNISRPRPRMRVEQNSDPDEEMLGELMEMQQHSPDRVHQYEKIADVVAKRHLKSLKFMLDNRKDQYQPYVQAINYAAKKGDLEICRILVDAISPKREDLEWPILNALYEGFNSISEFLLDAATGKIETRSAEQQQFLDRLLLKSADNPNRAKGISKLLSHGANPNRVYPLDPDTKILMPEELSISALHLAAIHGCTDNLKLMLDGGGNVNLAEPQFGITPLHAIAMYRGVMPDEFFERLTKTIDLLISKGANTELTINKKNNLNFMRSGRGYRYPSDTLDPKTNLFLEVSAEGGDLLKDYSNRTDLDFLVLPEEATALDLAILCHQPKENIAALEKAGAKLRAKNADSMMQSIIYMIPWTAAKHAVMKELLALGAEPKQFYADVLKIIADPEGAAIIEKALQAKEDVAPKPLGP